MFRVYTKPNCTFCDQAKALLRANEQPFVEHHLDVGQPKQDGTQYVSREEILEAFPGARTMPQIMLDFDGHKKIIGGYQELKQYLKAQ